MDESKLRTIAPLEEFLKATPEVRFSGLAVRADSERYEHISGVLKRLDYPYRIKRERGVVAGLPAAHQRLQSRPDQSVSVSVD